MSRGQHRSVQRRPRARRRLAAAGLALVLAIGAGWAARSQRRSDPPKPPVVAGRLHLDFPAVATAADQITVTVRGAPAGETVSLVAVGSLGTSVQSTAAGTAGAAFALSANTLRAAGVVTLIGRSAGATGSGTIHLRPGPVVGPIMPRVGYRSILANGVDASMVVAVPADRVGNALADGTPVTVVHRRPNGTVEQTTVLVKHLMTFTSVTSRTVAGGGAIRVGVNGTAGQVVSLDEVAEPPVPFTLAAVGPVPAADGQSLLFMQTSVLRDRFGNPQPDGTAVALHWSGRAGQASASGYVSGGRAYFGVRAPTLPDAPAFTATCRGVGTAQSLAVRFRSVTPAAPTRASRGPEGLVIVVGPVSGELGAYVPDGTVADVTVTDDAGNAVSGSGQLINGTVRLVLPSSALSGVLHVVTTVLGVVTRSVVT